MPHVTLDRDYIINTLSKAQRATHLTRCCFERRDVVISTNEEDEDKDLALALLDMLDDAHDALALAHAYINGRGWQQHEKGGA